MKLKLRENADINVVTGISDIIIDSINKKWDNIRDLNSIIVNLNEEGFEDLVPVIESILEDENKNVGKLQQLVELISPTAKSIDDGKQEAIDELDNIEEIKVEEMKLDENFSNVPEETTTTVDPTFGKAIEDKEEDEKVIEDALKENEKLAKETIPKEGETGKNVTSKALKAMHLSEALFDEDLSQSEQMSLNSDVFHALEDVAFKWRDSHLTPDEWIQALEWFEFHFIDDGEWDESLNEGIEDKKKDLEKQLINFLKKKEFENKFKISDEDKKEFIAKTLKMISKSNIRDRKTTGKEIADLVNRLFNMSFTQKGEYYAESIKFDIAKEQLKRFKEGKMPKDWTPNDYIKDLVNKNHLTKEEGDQLLSEDFITEEYETVEEIKKEVRRLLTELTEAYRSLDDNKFDVSASIIETLKFEITKLSEAMQNYNWTEND